MYSSSCTEYGPSLMAGSVSLGTFRVDCLHARRVIPVSLAKNPVHFLVQSKRGMVEDFDSGDEPSTRETMISEVNGVKLAKKKQQLSCAWW